MPDVLIRDIDVAVLDRVKLRAKIHNRSLQSEMKMMVNEFAEKPEPLSEFELISKIRASIKTPQTTDSVELLREDRNR